jgi:hypothetical protein
VGAGGSDHVAAFAVLEEADARLVKVDVGVAHAGGAAAVQEVAPSPPRDGVQTQKGK